MIAAFPSPYIDLYEENQKLQKEVEDLRKQQKEEKPFVLGQKVGLVKEVEQLDVDGNARRINIFVI